MPNLIDHQQIFKLADSIKDGETCPSCATLDCAGWESLPAVFDQSTLKIIGTLKIEDAPENWDEYHPNGTQIWSPDAPIALGYHPYNRCDLYGCTQCSRIYLRYTEFGGYYIDQRIRALNPKLLIDPAN